MKTSSAKLEQWAARACLNPTARKRKALENTPYGRFLALRQGGAVRFGCDGIRAHLVLDAEPTLSSDDKADGDLKVVLDLASQVKATGHISTFPLKQAAKMALAFGGMLKLSANGALVASSRGPDGEVETALYDGDSWAKWEKPKKTLLHRAPRYTPIWVVYQKTGPDTEVLVDPRFVLDALAGLGEVIEFGIAPFPYSLLTLSDEAGHAQAVIMGRTG